MNWVIGIQRAIDYIEENLCEKIDYDEAAKCAYSSVFHFQRIFSMLCGFTVGDYIRQRRLTLAGEELLGSDKKVIDIALKYGYDSPESFARAFYKFHGIKPSEAKKGGKLKHFSKISVKLTLTGGNTMDYRIEKMSALKILCKRTNVSKPVDDTATENISAFWGKCGQDGTITKLCERIPKDTPIKGLLGICFSSEIKNSEIPYGIGFALGDEKVDTSDFEIAQIPAATYAVFKVKGKMPDAFQETYKRICGEFLVQSEYDYAGIAELEVYPSDDIANPNYECEIWVAVK